MEERNIAMNIIQINENVIELNDIYRINNDDWEAYKIQYGEKELSELIDKLSEPKIRFVESPNCLKHTGIKSVLSNAFIYSEMILKKDLHQHNYEEILNLFKVLGDEKIIRSNASYSICLNIICEYTKWAYEENLRDDMILVEDVTAKFPVSKLIETDIISNTTLTWNEMKNISKMCSEVVEIGILGFLSGLKTKEILELKLSDFEDKENHPIQLEKRVVELSNELYKKCRKYSNVTSVLNTHTWFVNKLVSPLADTGYLIRPIKKARSGDGQMSPNSYAYFFRTDLNDCGFSDVEQRNLRTSCILNDVVDKRDIEYINKKYGLNYKNTNEIIKNKKQLEILILKRKAEGSL